MKIVIQRSGASSVSVAGELISKIEKGMVLLVCMENGDNERAIQSAAEKILKLRIFKDENDRMNLNILQNQGEILAISQFTLSWDGKKGNRPGFENSMAPDQAEKFFQSFCSLLRDGGVPVSQGKFGADMLVNIENQGPVTFHLSF